MDPQEQGLEAERAVPGDDDLAVEDAALRQRGAQRLGQLREVAIQRLQVARLRVDLVAVAEDEGAEAVPFGLEQPAVVRRGARRTALASIGSTGGWNGRCEGHGASVRGGTGTDGPASPRCRRGRPVATSPRRAHLMRTIRPSHRPDRARAGPRRLRRAARPASPTQLHSVEAGGGDDVAGSATSGAQAAPRRGLAVPHRRRATTAWSTRAPSAPGTTPRSSGPARSSSRSRTSRRRCATARDAIVGLGGYVGASNTSNGDDRPTAEITYRIPAGRWEEALDALRSLNGLTTKVVTEQTQAVEVTGQVVDLAGADPQPAGQRDRAPGDRRESHQDQRRPRGRGPPDRRSRPDRAAHRRSSKTSTTAPATPR